MRVNFSSFECTNNKSMMFSGARARKLIKKVNDSEKMDKLKISFEELEAMYQEIGYDVIYKRGSHAVIVISDKVRLSLVHPHGKRKGLVTPTEIKKLRYVAQGEIEKAIAME